MTQIPFESVPVETVRSYWNARPCNIRHSPKPVGTREYFDEVEERKYFVEPHIPGFAEFPKWKGKRVLEIGCGIGTDTINFARAGANVFAVDLSDRSLEVARERAKVFGFENNIRFIQANAEEIDKVLPRGEKYDLVYSFGVIHHTPHPEVVVSHVRNLLAPGGEFRVMVYSKASYKLFWMMREEAAWDMGRIDEVIARNSEAQTGCPVTYTYTFETLKELLAGFEIIEAKKAHIFTWDIERYKHYEYEKDPAWAKVGDQELADLESELGWHMLAKARLAR